MYSLCMRVLGILINGSLIVQNTVLTLRKMCMTNSNFHS